MEAVELARWTRFAAKGGIGKCTALCDCVAENADDLMFLKDDEITVLMQLSEPPGMYLGYCEGVVGRFLGTNVHFHSRLKKPVKAKRSSVTAPGKSPTPRTRVSIDEHVAAGLILPPSSSPDGVPGVKKVRLSSGIGSRRSSGTQERSDGELGYSSSRGASPAMPMPLSPPLRPPSNLGLGLGSSTPPIHAPTPPLHGSPHAASSIVSYSSSRHMSMLSSYSQATEYEGEPKLTDTTSVDTTINPSLDTATSKIPSSTPPPRPVTTNVIAPTPHTIATSVTVARLSQTMANTTSSIPPSTSQLSNSSLYASTSTSSTIVPQSSKLSSPPPTSLPSATTNPDTSASTHFDTSRISLALSDGEVGIGLSLLQDLADGEAWSGSDSDSSHGGGATKVRKGSFRSRGSLRRRGTKEGNPIAMGPDVRASTISEASRYSNNSSEDGLGYEDTETGHSTLHHTQEALQLDADITQTQAAFSYVQQQPVLLHQHPEEEEGDDDAESPVLGRSEQLRMSRTLGQQMMTFPPVAPLSPSKSRFIPPEEQDQQDGDGMREHFEFPTPPTHTPRMSFSHRSTVSTSTAASASIGSPPTSFTRPQHFSSISTSNAVPQTLANDSRVRRPSTVSTNSTSTPSVAGSDNWDADIYDDYRYSRFSSGTTHTTGARSFSSRMSIGSRAGINGFAAEGRPSVDSANIGAGSRSSTSTGMRQSTDSQSAPALPKGRTRSRSNATASLNPVVLSPTAPSLTPAFVQQSSLPPPPTQEPQVPPPRPPTESPRQPHQLSPPVSPLAVPPTRHRATDSESSGSVYSAQPSARLDGSFGPSSAKLDGTFGTSVPPSPLGAVSFVPSSNSSSHSDTATSSASTRPAPLQLTSSNYTSPTIPASNPQPFSPTTHQYAQDPHHNQQHLSIRSPLLHTGWGSVVSSPASTTAQFTAMPADESLPTSTDDSTPSTGSAPSTGGGAMNGREMSAFFPAGLDALGKVVAQQGVEVRERESGMEWESKIVGVEMHGDGKIIVEEDEDDDRVVLGRGLAIGEHETEGADVGQSEDDEDHDVSRTLVMGGRVIHESPSIASSPEPEPEIPSKVKSAQLVAHRTPSPMIEDEDEEDAEEIEREKEELRRQLAAGSTPVSSSTPAVSQPPTTAPAPSTTSSEPPLPPPTIISPPPASTPSLVPPASHLRPTLAEIRPSAERQSLFLPHPNAPKATPTSLSPGPMYISQTQPPPPQTNTQRMRGGVMQTIHMALTGQGPPSGPRGRGPTIYGITTTDLSASMGPVLMHFSVTPPPATAPPPGSVPAPRIVTSPPPAAAPPRVSSTLFAVSSPPPPPQPQSVAAPIPRIAVRRVGSVASLDVAPASSSANMEHPGSGASGVIPRANFFPKAGGVRPRSRSFSGFQSPTTEVPLPVQRSGSDLEDQPAQIPTVTEVKRSLSPIIGSPTTPSSSSGIKGSKPSPLRVSSPLSRQENSISTTSRPIRPPNSPMMQSFATPFSQPASSSSLPSSPTTTSPPRLLRQTASRSTLSGETPAPRPAPRARATLDSVTTPSPPAPHTPEPRGRPSADGDSASVHSTRSNVVSPPLGRNNSLRSKLSLPNLNLRRTGGRADEPMSPLSPTAEADLLQVQDMDFELVRPNLGHLQGARSSEDSGVMGRDMSVDARQDGSFLRADSSMSLHAPRSPTVISDGGWTPSLKSTGRGGTDSEASQSASQMDAHRHREQKWMAVLASVQPAQSRKSKKVKKLIFDGVPSSVRYLVWSMLTDGKARCVPGVYAQLGGRGKVAALAEVQRDVQRCFADHPQLQSTQGPVLTLLQAYLTMVPDVQYMTGLTLIAGHLLLHSPEEDAFWIFVSVMDSHIRPYFSTTSIQIDVDSTLFSRAMDAADPTLAKKLFGDMGVSPSSICRPWFTSLFVGSLPPDYLNRVWDIFLFEGVPFLFRIALVLVSCSRRQIFDAPSADAALNNVLRPSPELLPTSPEALVTLALSVKLKDDDLRKQRVKLEAQIKRQTQPPRPTVSTPSAISLPRT